MKIQRHLAADGTIETVALQPDGTLRALDGDLFAHPAPGSRSVPPGKLLIPYQPRSILGIGANYRSLFKDKPLPDYPVVFFKHHNALQNPGDPVILPRLAIRAETVKFEGELAVVIGRGGKNIPVESAMEHVYGYTIANDVSASDWQRERVGNQWCKGKGFDTFCPLGPTLVTRDEIPDPSSLRIVTRVNGRIEQDETVDGMCFPVAELIAFLSAGHTLAPGDLILTGTPSGARFLDPGDLTEITIDPIGTLSNPWQEESA